MNEPNFDLNLEEIADTEETTEVEVADEVQDDVVETEENAEGTEESSDSTEDVEESNKSTEEGETEQFDFKDMLEALQSKVKYMDKEVKIESIDDVIENYQKGLDYKRQVEKKERIENQLKSFDELVKTLYPNNIKSTEQLLEALVQHEIKLLEQEVSEKYGDEKDRAKVLKGDERYNSLKSLKPVKFETEVEIEKLNSEVDAINKTYGEKFTDYRDIPVETRELAAEKGLSLAEAYKLSNFDKIMEKKLDTTRKSLMAELSEGKKKTLPQAKKSGNSVKEFYTLDQIQSMSDKDIADNYDKVMKSYQRIRQK
jgi:hypothetical protein